MSQVFQAVKKQLAGMNEENSLSFAVRNKVVPQLLSIELKGSGNDSFSVWKDKSSHVLIQNNRVCDELNRLVNQGIEFWYCKGPSLQQLYPIGEQRYFHDIDLLVPDLKSGVEIVYALEKIGYALEGGVYFGTVLEDSFIGGARLRKGGESLHEGIEIHIGGFTYGKDGLIPCDSFRALNQYEQTFLIFLAEIDDRSEYILRDFIDFSCICEKLENSRSPYLMSILQIYNLNITLCKMLDSYSENYAESGKVYRAKFSGPGHVAEVGPLIQARRHVLNQALRILQGILLQTEEKWKRPGLFARLTPRKLALLIFKSGALCALKMVDLEAYSDANTLYYRCENFKFEVHITNCPSLVR